MIRVFVIFLQTFIWAFASASSGEPPSLPARPNPSQHLINSYIQIPNFMLQRSGSDLRVDPNLEIIIVRRYSLSVAPEMVWPDHHSVALSATSHLRDGNYLLRISLFLGDDTLRDDGLAHTAPPVLVDSYQKIVQAVGGRINTQIEFSSKDMVVWGGRNSLALELYPVHSDAQTKRKKNFNLNDNPRIFWGSFTPSNEFSNVLVAKMDSSKETFLMISKFIEAKYRGQQMSQHQGPLADEPTSASTTHPTNPKTLHSLEFNKSIPNVPNVPNVNNFAQANNLKLISVSDSLDPDLKINKEFIFELARNGTIEFNKSNLANQKIQQLLRPFCRATFLTPSLFEDSRPIKSYSLAAQLNRQCENDPLSFFILEHRIHVIDPSPKSRWLGGRAQSFNISNSFELAVGHSLSATLSKGPSLMAETSVKPISIISQTLKKVPFLNEIFSGSVGFLWNQSSLQSDTVSNHKQNNFTITRGLFLVEQQAVMEISIQRYQSCLSIRFNEEKITNIKGDKTLPWPFSGYYFCADPINEPIKLLETYYFFSQQFANGDFIDPRHPANRPFVLSLRGHRDYFVFLNQVSHLLRVTTSTHLSNENPQDVFAQGAELFANQHRAYPASISTYTSENQIQFILQGEVSAESSQILRQFLNELSPFTRHSLKALD